MSSEIENRMADGLSAAPADRASTPGTGRGSRRGATSYLLWIVAGLVLAYALFHASTTILLIVAGVFVALVALAVGVCIYAQNNTPLL